MKQRARVWLLAFGLLGLGASAASFYVHYRMLRDPAYSSFCNFNETINCAVAYQSRFASVRGVPIALGGVIWFTLALLVTVGMDSRSAADEPGAPGYLFVLATPALGVMLFLAYVSIIVLKAVCILCAITYLAIIGIFLVSGTATRAPLKGLPRRAFRDMRMLLARPVALAVAILFLAGAASAVAFFPKAAGGTANADSPAPLSASQQMDFDRWLAAQPRVPIVLPTDGAQVVIVKFNDYQCPACGASYKSDHPILAKYEAASPGAVKLVMKDYPLESECNPNVSQTVHEAACEGAVAVRLAQRHQRGPAMEDWLYTHQENITPAAVRQAARDIGGVTEFDIEYPRILVQIKDDVELGRRLGVNGTPTFFINGMRVEGGLRPEYLDAAIAHELKAASPGKP